ncbi:hypothetical protein GCM10023264_02670 [Sphingomonas daechungensis]|uniref:Uncharacterized protein n=1 Tax=Sphingomonas daechungensis TaxID=1176646 RepID=A0ABX6SYR6_9SPHN|nr:hypothetical protein [Sphingomonas daechungensis]QNP42716.1 hypothetical protein H9L15_11330 [Sphingomonas daechungensis]
MNLAVLIPIAGIAGGVAIMWMCFKYLELRITDRKALDDVARETAEKKRLEARVAILERIVTDRGIQTADQIDALVERDALDRESEQVR